MHAQLENSAINSSFNKYFVKKIAWNFSVKFNGVSCIYWKASKLAWKDCMKYLNNSLRQNAITNNLALNIAISNPYFIQIIRY